MEREKSRKFQATNSQVQSIVITFSDLIPNSVLSDGLATFAKVFDSKNRRENKELRLNYYLLSMAK